MGKVALHLLVCFLAVTCFLSTPVIGCGRWAGPEPSGDCKESECEQGTCVQIGDHIIRECATRDELRFTLPVLPEPKQLYRVLRDDENPALGLIAKNPAEQKSIQSHVGCGSRSYYRSQWISTTASLQAAKDWASLNSNRAQYKIAVINVDCLKRHGIKFVDLRDPTTQALQLPGIVAQRVAKRYQEVLVLGQIPIPAECIEGPNSYSSTSRNDLC